jgi:hypothetical protein
VAEVRMVERAETEALAFGEQSGAISERAVGDQDVADARAAAHAARRHGDLPTMTAVTPEVIL